MKKILLWTGLVSLAFIILFFCSEQILTKSTNPLSKADLIIVLGNPVNKDGSVGTTQKSRVDAGIDLLNRGYSNKILFTGGQSKNTIENAFFTNKLIQDKPSNEVIVVTSAYHTLRAEHIFSQYIDNLQLKAVPYAKELGMIYRIKAMLHEYAAWLYYSINGWEVDKTVAIS